MPVKSLCIFSKTSRTLFNSRGLFTSQLLCGSSLSLPPLAPPLLSEPLNVDADAHAVLTNSEIVKLESVIIFLRFSISESLNI